MGIGELRSKVVMEMRYDVSDARASLKGLQGDEKKLAEMRVQLGELENKRLQKLIDNYGRLSTGLQAANMAGLDLGKSIRELTNIPIGGPGTSLGFMFGGSWGAAIGTIGEMLGGFLADKFTAHTRDVRKLHETYIAVMESQIEFNKVLEDTFTATQKAQRASDDAAAHIGGMNRALAENTDHYKSAKDGVIAYTFALDKLKTDRRASPGFGQDTFVDRQEIEIERSLRDARIKLAGATSHYGTVAADARIKTLQHADALKDAKDAYKAGEMSAKEYRDTLTGLGVKFEDLTKKQKEYLDIARQIGLIRDTRLDTEGNAWEREQAARTALVSQYETDEDLLDQEFGDNQQRPDGSRKLAELAKAKRESLVANMFGPLEGINAYKTAFDGLSNSVVAGYSAMVDGSMSFGAAFKLAIAGSLKAAGTEMLVLALKETAYGFASIALGPVGGASAAAHFKSAALFGAGAIAAGVAAHGLSGGGAASAGSRPSAPSGGGSSGSGGTSSAIIVYDDAFADSNAHEKQLRAERLVRRVVGSGAVRPS